MQLLDEMRDERIHEYNSLVFSTYSALKQAAQPKQAAHEQERESYEAVLAARRNTETLVYELKSLYHNIRGYIRRIQEQNDINELLENHFEKYKPMTDRIYHPIKTLDSFYRYMAPVRDLYPPPANKLNKLTLVPDTAGVSLPNNATAFKYGKPPSSTFRQYT